MCNTSESRIYQYKVLTTTKLSYRFGVFSFLSKDKYPLIHSKHNATLRQIIARSCSADTIPVDTIISTASSTIRYTCGMVLKPLLSENLHKLLVGFIKHLAVPSGPLVFFCGGSKGIFSADMQEQTENIILISLLCWHFVCIITKMSISLP